MSRNNVGSQPLERPWTKRNLIRDLAFTKLTQTELGVKYGTTREAVNRFKQKYKQEITEVLAQADSEFVGIAIADKANRLAAYEEMLMKAMDENDRKSAVRILRNVAEEMGHLPSRMQISGAVDVHTTYTVTDSAGAPIDISRLT